MDKQQAQELIKETFESSFDKVRFKNFIKNLLNRIDKSKAFKAQGYAKEGFRGIIITYERIGTYTNYDNLQIVGGTKILRRFRQPNTFHHQIRRLCRKPKKQAKALEAEIDQLVYKLCDLTSEEIKIVEGNGLKTKEKKAKLQKHINSEVT